MVPDYDVLRLCAECEGELIRSADDRGSTAEDHYRLMDMGRRLVGEVWSAGDHVYWFRDPILVRIPPSQVPAKPSEIPRRKRAPARPRRKAARKRSVTKRGAKKAARKRPAPKTPARKRRPKRG